MAIIGKMDATCLKQLQKFQKGCINFINPFTSPSTIMEAAFGRLHNIGFRFAAPTVVESIMVDGEVNGLIKWMQPF